MKEIFSNNLKQFRKQKQLSQEQLAEQLGITTQAVSKWECGLSYPDIDLLPQLADLFCVSIDALLRGSSSIAAPNEDPAGRADGSADTADERIPFPQPDLPDDDVLRIVQYRGTTLLRKDTYDPNIRIPLSVDCRNQTKSFRNKIFVSVKDSDTTSAPRRKQIEIWGSADIFGDLNGSASVGTSLNCAGDIGGNASAGTSLSCGGDVGGDVCAGSNVDCGGDIGGDVRAGGNVDCGGDIGGHVSAHR